MCDVFFKTLLMFEIFKKKNNVKNDNLNKFFIMSPIEGKTIPLADVPDPVFSQKMMGDGLAINPTGDTFVAPAKGKISLIFNTKHAFAITLENGLELLVHIGLDTVSLKGNGFNQLCNVGDIVDVGTPIIRINRDIIKNAGLSLITPVLITNTEQIKNIKKMENMDVVSGETTIIEYSI